MVGPETPETPSIVCSTLYLTKYFTPLSGVKFQKKKPNMHREIKEVTESK